MMEEERGHLWNPERPAVKRFTFVNDTYAEPSRADEVTKVSRHRFIQQKFETIYPAWKQLIKEPWKDRGGLERFEYGMI